MWWGWTFFTTNAPSQLTDCHSKRLNSNPYGFPAFKAERMLCFSRDRRRCSKMTECRSPPLCLAYIRVSVTWGFFFHSIRGVGFLMNHFQTTPRNRATLPRLSRERIHAPGNGRCWLGNDFIKTRGIVLAKISFKNSKLYAKGNSLIQWNSLQLTLRMLDGCTNYPF